MNTLLADRDRLRMRVIELENGMSGVSRNSRESLRIAGVRLCLYIINPVRFKES